MSPSMVREAVDEMGVDYGRLQSVLRELLINLNNKEKSNQPPDFEMEFGINSCPAHYRFTVSNTFERTGIYVYKNKKK